MTEIDICIDFFCFLVIIVFPAIRQLWNVAKKLWLSLVQVSTCRKSMRQSCDLHYVHSTHMYIDCICTMIVHVQHQALRSIELQMWPYIDLSCNALERWDRLSLHSLMLCSWV